MRVDDIKKEIGKSNLEVAPRILEKHAQEIGDKPFFYYGEDKKLFTFKEFNEISNQLAHGLIDLGIKKGDRVCVFLRNALVTAVSMFGIWKCGAIYCRINFNYKGRLLSYQINDAMPRLLITEGRFVPLLNEIKSKVTGTEVVVYRPGCGDHDYDEKANEYRLDKSFKELEFSAILSTAKTNPEVELNYYDTANIIYTSGTTGPAKGVVQSYRWMNQYTYNSRKLLTQDDVIYTDLPLYHVGGAVQDVTRAAWVGCQVAVWDKFSIHEYWDRIRESKATCAILLDVVIPWLMSRPVSPYDRENTLNKVYMQPLPEYHHKVAERFGFDFVLAGYGQTEAGNAFFAIIDELAGEMGTPEKLWRGLSKDDIWEVARANGWLLVTGDRTLKKGFMGKPTPLVDAIVVDDYDQELGVGQVGEICFRPKLPWSMLTEYFQKPDATAEAFRNCWFHSGDVGYRDEEGVFYFVDRKGWVIRRRGENISSYQVEDFVNSHPKVKVSAAFPVPAEVGGEDEVAVVAVVSEGQVLTEDELRKWLEREMPRFMLPKYIKFMGDLPRTPTNKIEKYVLRKRMVEELGLGRRNRHA